MYLNSWSHRQNFDRTEKVVHHQMCFPISSHLFHYSCLERYGNQKPSDINYYTIPPSSVTIHSHCDLMHKPDLNPSWNRRSTSAKGNPRMRNADFGRIWRKWRIELRSLTRFLLSERVSGSWWGLGAAGALILFPLLEALVDALGSCCSGDVPFVSSLFSDDVFLFDALDLFIIKESQRRRSRDQQK